MKGQPASVSVVQNMRSDGKSSATSTTEPKVDIPSTPHADSISNATKKYVSQLVQALESGGELWLRLNIKVQAHEISRVQIITDESVDLES
jgi:hypothetical protein